MNSRPLTTIAFLVLSFGITIGASVFDSSLFGHDGHPTLWLSFMPEDPFRLYGLSIIFSPFLHLGLQHLITNFILLVPVAMMIERKKSGPFLAGLFVTLHLIILATMILLHQFKSMTGAGFLGMSHVIIALITYWSLSTKRYGMLMFAAFILAMGWWQSQSSLTILAHAIGLIVGALLFAVSSSWQKLRP